MHTPPTWIQSFLDLMLFFFGVYLFYLVLCLFGWLLGVKSFEHDEADRPIFDEPGPSEKFVDEMKRRRKSNRIHNMFSHFPRNF